MRLPEGTESEPPSTRPAFWRKILGKPSALPAVTPPHSMQSYESSHEEPMRVPAAISANRKVIAGLPRAQTFKRLQSEQRLKLSPVRTSTDERRAISVDRRTQTSRRRSGAQVNPRASAPGLLGSAHEDDDFRTVISDSLSQLDDETDGLTTDHLSDPLSSRGRTQLQNPDDNAETRSRTTSQHEAMINDELEKTWILNLSMHFRDRSKREKFFVTYREKEHLWRRVTISLDYRYAPPNSLEMDLLNTQYQREKSAKIYEAIRESLPDIKFYDTVTNLKLETTDGRLHVHVVEDGNEIINYPRVDQVRHLGWRRFRESDIIFDSHMSGFVYKVRVKNHTLIKKEIPSQDTIDEFLYEVNALNTLRYSSDIVKFYGVVVDDGDEYIKGLLISYASQGALIDIIFEHCKENGTSLPWVKKTRWARQIVQGLADIHDSGFVQGDFTLSNIVIDEDGDAKIIDINRRGCPVGWEPPEATALLDAGHRITMYIGVKSDLYQLGMVLWGLAVEEDEPEIHGRPLVLGPEVNVPDWYRQMTEICLSSDPRMRLQASSLLQLFPPNAFQDERSSRRMHSISVDDGLSLSEYLVDENNARVQPHIKTVEPSSDWPYSGRTYVDTNSVPYELYYPTRGRSPPSPLPSDVDLCELAHDPLSKTSWAANRSVRPSYTDIVEDETNSDRASQLEREHDITPTIEDRSLGMHMDPEMNEPSMEAAMGQAEALVTHDSVNRNGLLDTKPMIDSSPKRRTDGQDPEAPGVPTRPKLVTEQTAVLVEPLLKEQMSAATVAMVKERPRSRIEANLPVGDEQQDNLRETGTNAPLARTSDDTGHVMHERPYEGAAIEHRAEPGPGRTPIKSHDGSQNPFCSERGVGEGSEPEYMAAQGPRKASDNISAHEGRCEGQLTQPLGDTVPRSGELPALAPERPVSGVKGLFQPSLQIQQAKSDCPRRMDLPISLAGVGAAHMGLDDDLIREKGILDDDGFDLLLRPTTMSALMITTDAMP